ncbi:hypothetical protein CEJ83_20110 [Acinetobacter baumannii]|uniref:Maternal effect embryo arrest 59 n=1 Tax=Citrus sinensis TaxID=2711 RepID=A0ACB8IXI5_CITSI|nr:Maternal effect embryo arrest 59 [Citrus sinensis]PAL72726.1 hypothetical protein CEJ83_20110 [Acinetobacter baumannii]
MDRVRRPDRSDVHLSREEEAKMEDEVRENFENLAPKRHTKPQRSDYSSQYVDAFANGSDSNQEYSQFQHLQANDSQKLIWNGSEVTEEFQETEYYKDLNRINKDHHTTGTGFIKMENANGKSFILAPDNDDAHHSSCKGNPATNEWIPSADDSVVFSSDKPKRSEN